MLQPLLQRATDLQADIERLRSEAEQLKTWTVVTVRRQLRSFEKQKREAEAATSQLHSDMNAYLDSLRLEPPQGATSMGLMLAVQIPRYLVDVSQASRESALCVLALQRLQDASSGLGAIIERKHAYELAFISLYVGLISTVVSMAVGLWAGAPTAAAQTQAPSCQPKSAA